MIKMKIINTIHKLIYLILIIHAHCLHMHISPKFIRFFCNHVHLGVNPEVIFLLITTRCRDTKTSNLSEHLPFTFISPGR